MKKPLLLFSALGLGALSPASAQPTASEPFDYPAGCAPEVMIDGRGWNTGQRRGWTIVVKGSKPDLVVEGSLDYTDPKGIAFPASGNRLQGKEDTAAVAIRGFDLDSPAWERAVVDATAESGEFSRRGFGKAGGTVWFSFLARTSGQMSVQLGQDGYNMTPNGIRFQISAEKGLKAGQLWWAETGSDDAIKFETPESFSNGVYLIVARIDFGEDWDATASSKVSMLDKKSNQNRGQATGKLTVWINPEIGKAPDESRAAGSCQLVPFRFDHVRIALPGDSAADEIRMATSFEDLVAKP